MQDDDWKTLNQNKTLLRVDLKSHAHTCKVSVMSKQLLLNMCERDTARHAQIPKIKTVNQMSSYTNTCDFAALRIKSHRK